ncbi:hypothetical protein NHQ30_011193 [Ciborinia camelliae]|nr:hypothetical protein NHQ30_011193 [Ciborinia camelliae]
MTRPARQKRPNCKPKKDQVKAMPKHKTIYAEQIESLHHMTYEERVEFVKMMDEKKLRMSNRLGAKAKAKTQFKLPTSEAHITKLPTEIINQIGDELGLFGCHNKVPLSVDHGHFGVFWKIGAAFMGIDIVLGGIQSAVRNVQGSKGGVLADIGQPLEYLP